MYTKTDRGICFRSERRPGEVRVPNYVFDLWLPLLGAEAIGVYSLYCRLEMHGAVKKITLADIATACQVGKDKLRKINDLLQACGFIEVRKPEGAARLMHWTTEIVIKDPPTEVSKDLIERFRPGYQVLTTWLVDEADGGKGQEAEPIQALKMAQTGLPGDPNGSSGGPKQVLRTTQISPPDDPNRSPNIATLDILNPLNVATLDVLQPLKDIPRGASTLAIDPNQPNVQVDLVDSGDSLEDAYPTRLHTPVDLSDSGDSPEDEYRARLRVAAIEGMRRVAPPMSIPRDAGGADDWTDCTDAFAAYLGIDPATLPFPQRKEWSRALEKVGRTWNVGPGVVLEAIRALPESQFNWKSYANPHQAAADLGVVIGQILNGGVRKPPAKQSPGERVLEATRRLIAQGYR